MVIPSALRPQVLELLHLGHCGMQRMKQLARTVVFWSGIDSDIIELCRTCTACAEHQSQPPKAPSRPWMMPEKPWSRVHVDHAINFMGSHWLIMVDAHSKYPCVHSTTSTSTKTTIDLLSESMAHFGYPHTIVTDNATTFSSEEFKQWCRERGITHLTGAPYHPATNGTAERFVQTFKQALRKSSLPPKQALQEFLLQYRRTPLASGYSQSEKLNGRQIRSKIDAVLPSPIHIEQGRQSVLAKSSPRTTCAKVRVHLKVGTPCYAQYHGPRRNREPRWVPATITKVLGSRTVNVRVWPRGPTWRRHLDQLQPRYGAQHDAEVEDLPTPAENAAMSPEHQRLDCHGGPSPQMRPPLDIPQPQRRKTSPPQKYDRSNPRRSKRLRKPRVLFGC